MPARASTSTPRDRMVLPGGERRSLYAIGQQEAQCVLVDTLIGDRHVHALHAADVSSTSAQIAVARKAQIRSDRLAGRADRRHADATRGASVLRVATPTPSHERDEEYRWAPSPTAH